MRNILQLIVFVAAGVLSIQSRRRLQGISIRPGEWIEKVGIRRSFPAPRPDLVKSYSMGNAHERSNSTSSEQLELGWQPQNVSDVRPVFDKRGFCSGVHHLMRSKGKSQGSIVFVGDDEVTARTSLSAAALLYAHETDAQCSRAGRCTHSICGKERKATLQFISTKDFIRSACLHTEGTPQPPCVSSAALTNTLLAADVILFNFGAHLATVHAQGGVSRLESEITFIADWINDNYAVHVNTTALVMYQSMLPEAKYCGVHANKTDEQLHTQFLHLQRYDANLYNRLVTGKVGRHPQITLEQIDIAGAVFAREELQRSAATSFSEIESGLCELLTLYSDSVLLLLSHIYGALLQHITPAIFPKVSLVQEGEDYDHAMQRVSLQELTIVNYIRAKWELTDAIATGWKLPSDKAVTLSITDIRYNEAFAYWYFSRRMYAVEGIMIAMDAMTCDHLKATYPTYLSLCMHIPYTMSVAPPHKLNTIVAAGKIVYPLLFLAEYRIPVIFSEMDIFWKSDPFPYLNHTDRSAYDIQVSAHVYFNNRKVVTTVPKELNIGFFYLRPTRAAILLFTDLLHFLTLWTFATVDIATMDQKLFDLFIRNIPGPPGEQTPCCLDRLVGWEKIRPPTHFEGFKWLRLDGAVFTHNDAMELAIVPQTITYHISWGIDPPSRRIHCADTLGLLPSNYTRITTYDNQVCFPYLYQ